MPEFKDYKTKPIKGLRFYQIDDHLYPSVTSVLGLTTPAEKKASLESWRTSLGPAKADAYTKACGDRGTILHTMLEQYLKGEVVQVAGAGVVEWGMFNGIKMKLRKVSEVVGQEVVLYSHGLAYAGRCDLIAIYKDELCIIDFKSSTNTKGDARIEDYKLQLCMYGLAYDEMFGTEIKTGVILMGVENGVPQEFKVNFDNELIGKVLGRVDQFYSQLAI